MRLINADVIDMEDMDFHTGQTRSQACEAAQDIVDAQLSVDAEPVVHAHWEEKEESDECSYCGFEVPISFPICKRCPNCGAKMKEEADD